MNESLKKFAKELKSFREAKDISLQYIANRTKIDIKFLQAIEDGNFDILPELYMRSFIKEYAKEADFDVNEVMKRYDLARKGVTEDNSSLQAESKETANQKKDSRNETEQPQITKSLVNDSTDSISKSNKKKYVEFIYYGISILVIVSIATYFIFFNKTNSEELELSNYKLSQNSSNRFELASDSTQEFLGVEDDSLKLELKASDKVWVKVLSDNKAVYQDFILKNENLVFKAGNEFRVSVGNAGSVSMELNKKLLPLPGIKGEVRSYIINKDTVKSYLISVPAKNENRSQ